MVLAVNISNTTLTVSGYVGDRQAFCGRLHSDPLATEDEYALLLQNLLTLYGCRSDQIEGAIMGSVVPVLTDRVLGALHRLSPVRVLTVGPGLKSGLKLRLDNPAQLGAEMLCGTVAALAECEGPLVIIHADTAISMMATNRSRELIGGVILPGPQVALHSLVQNTAQLPQVALSSKRPLSILGTNTEACLQQGILLGTACQLDGLAARFCAELGPETQFFCTGSLPACILEACATPIHYRESLVLDGLYLIWQRNRK